MHTFRDTLNREWEIRLTVDEVLDLQPLGLDLYGEDSLAALGACFANLPRFAQVLLRLTRDQRAERGLDEREFLAGCTAETFDQASAAILDELVLFCPARLRSGLSAAIAHARAIPTPTAATTKNPEPTSPRSSSGSPASSASTPVP